MIGGDVMLSDYISDVQVQEQLRRQSAGADLDGFSQWLADRRYSAGTIRSYLDAVGKFMPWARTHGFASEGTPDYACFAHYSAYLRRRYRSKRGDSGNRYCGARRYWLFLQQSGRVSFHLTLDPLEVRFHSWLRDHRGVSERTLDNYARIVRRLLAAVGNEPSRYTAAQLRSFVLGQAKGHSHSMTDTVVTSVRLFIRFLIAEKACPENLQHAIPRVAGWRQATMPRYLDPADVERSIATCDPSASLGSRDRAILLLLARLGLRAGDVSGLRLQDVDWTNARVRASGKVSTPAWLPLPQDVGDAIMHYINTARPAASSDALFLISYAPYTRLHSRQVSATAERAIRRSGVETRSLGAHQFRHSAATAWLRQGMTLQAVGTLLRHNDLDTTAIYAKVDINLLRCVAQRWPQEDSPC
jgi:integrase/recombinase XerD